MSSLLPWIIGAGVLFAATRPAQANTAITPGGLKRDRPDPATVYGDMKPQTRPRKPPPGPEALEIPQPDLNAIPRSDYWPDGDDSDDEAVAPPPSSATGPGRPIPVGDGRAFQPRVGPSRAPTRVRFPDGFERAPEDQWRFSDVERPAARGVSVGDVGRRFRPLDLDGLSREERERSILSAVVDITNLDLDDVSVTPQRGGLVFTFQEPPARKPSSKVTLYGKWEVPPIPSMDKLVRIGSVLPKAFFQAYRDEHSTHVLQLVVPG